MNLYADVFPTPVADVVLAVDARGAVKRLDFVTRSSRDDVLAVWRRRATVALDPVRCAAARRQVEEYFAGQRTAFDAPADGDGTPFQREVWRALQAIPFGETASYGEIARRIGRPAASRAVGRANGLNPIALLVPCHRVIGADGSLTGYAGGLPAKQALLDFERGQLSSTR
jgi:O-6-methylguanine DNA methyltransferase